MNELYWITRLDSLNIVINTIFCLSVVATIIFIITAIICDSQVADGWAVEYNKKWNKIAVNWIKFLIPNSIIFALLLVFTPTTKEAFIIYGVGGTIDYIKSDSVATQIPHKAIVALDKWVEQLSEDDNQK